MTFATLGPLVADATGVHVLTANGGACLLRREDVVLRDSAGEVVLPWPQVWDVHVEAPSVGAVRWWLLAASQRGRAPTVRRTAQTVVRVTPMAGPPVEVALGLPPRGRYRLADLEALSAVTATLARLRRLDALGDPTVGALLADAGRAAAVGGVIRIRRDVERLTEAFVGG